jgi:hypothetical protein
VLGEVGDGQAAAPHRGPDVGLLEPLMWVALRWFQSAGGRVTGITSHLCCQAGCELLSEYKEHVVAST